MQDVAAVARSDDHGAVGQLVEQVLERHGAHEHVEHLAAEQLGVAQGELATHGLHERGHGGCVEERVLGDGPAGQGARRQRGQLRTHVLDAGGQAAVGDDGDGLRVVRAQLGHADLGEVRDGLGGALTARDDQEDGGAQVRGDPRVERELGRAGDVGVVRPDDDHEVALLGDLVVPGDDLRERGLGVGVHVVVGDADGLLVGEVDAVVREQELQHVVAVLACAGVGRCGPTRGARGLDGGRSPRDQRWARSWSRGGRPRPAGPCGSAGRGLPGRCVDFPVSPSGEAR